MTKSPSQTTPFNSRILLTAVHILCLSLYLIPILTYHPPTPKHGGPVLDEMHIVNDENRDAMGTSDLREVFQNDYWGRPMTSSSSHKSWRPLTILSFRWLNYIMGQTDKQILLQLHRTVNVLTHAAAAECTSRLALAIVSCSTPSHALGLKILVKLWFALHPTHVEVTANAANRAHLLSLLASVCLCDPNMPIALVGLLQLCGLLACETFLFSLPALLLTLLLVKYKRLAAAAATQEEQPCSQWDLLSQSLQSLLPRYFILILLSLSYLVGRYVFDTLSIPEGLIRPAENPFYEFQGWHRVRNYAYVLSIHVLKSWNVDLVGFSHEYGFDCVAAIDSWRDVRLLLPLGIAVAVVTALVYVYRQKSVPAMLLLLFHFSWMATLFPISGFVKVGTFIADRIVVTSSISTSILLGIASSRWIQMDKPTTAIPTSPHQRRNAKVAIILICWLPLGRRVHRRTLDWMDSEALLQSSLETCPRSAKSNLEISKVYSGLYPDKLNLTRSLYHLEQAESIDPDYCDVHQQFAHVFVQQQRYLEMEERLVKGILCPFSMGGSVEMWKRYWQAVLKMDPSAKERMEQYNAIIQQAVEEEQRRANQGQGSPRWDHQEL